MSELTDEQKLAQLLEWAEVVHDETSVSYEELMNWSPQRLHDAWFPFSGTAYSFYPAIEAFAIAGVIAGSLGLALGIGSVVGVTFSLSGAMAAAANTAIRASVYQALRMVNSSIAARSKVEGEDLTASVDDVQQWVEKLVKSTTPDIDQTPEEYASNYVAREEALRIARLKLDIANNVVDINRDGKLDMKDKALIAKYGSASAAIEALYGLPSDRAADIPGESGVSEDLSVMGEGGYTDEFMTNQRDGRPLGAAVSGSPKPAFERGEKMSYYNRGYGQYRGGGKWMTVQPGTPGAFPSKINPGQWITRRRY